MNNIINFSEQKVKSKDLKTVVKSIKSGWLTHGKYTELFENEFKKFTNAKYCVTVSSCTAGLHLSCLVANLKKGDEVLVPAMTHTATSHAVEYVGAKPRFVDIEMFNGTVSIESLKKNITKKTKALIIVHMSGYPCKMKEISEICKKNKIKLIEDCAHSIGTKYNSRHVGLFGMTGCFSFYPTKQITTGEGGMVITNDKAVYKKIKMLKAFGIDKDINNRKKPGHYDVKLLGLNYRMTDFQAALGYKQIISYKKNLRRRHQIAKKYIQNFSKSKLIKYMPYSSNSSYFIFQIFCKNRDLLLKHLKNKNIGVSVHYTKPVPEMTYYKKKYNLNSSNYLNANIYSSKNISLPVYPSLKDLEIKYICKVLNKFNYAK